MWDHELAITSATVRHSQSVRIAIWKQNKWKILPIDQSRRMGKENNVMTCAVIMSKPYVCNQNTHMLLYQKIIVFCSNVTST